MSGNNNTNSIDENIKLRHLIEINSYIAGTLDRDEVMQRILNQVTMILQCQLSSILLVDESLEQLKFSYMSMDEEKQILQDTGLKMGEGIAGSVWANGIPMMINDVQSDSRFSRRVDEKSNNQTRSVIAVPLVVNGRIIGVMEAINKIDGVFSSFDLQAMQYISTQSAIAINNANLYVMAISDGMTKLFIKKYFRERLYGELTRADRYSHPLCLVMLDIDHFKKVNDTYGHLAGDRVLIDVARVIKESCRSADLPCRYGGEEFAVILPETRLQDGFLFTERIRKKIEEIRCEFQGLSIGITISAGIVSVDDSEPADIEQFIEMADKALYYSKNNGRNRTSVYSDLNK